MDEMDEMIEDFLAEARERREAIEELLLGMEECEPAQLGDKVNELFRAVHSIKGAAGLMEYDHMGELLHSMETLLCEVRRGALEVDTALISVLLDGLDLLNRMLADLSRQEAVDTSATIHSIASFFPSAESSDQEFQSSKSEVPDRVSSTGSVPIEASAVSPSTAPKTTATDPTKVAPSSETVRVPVGALDSLMALAGELVLVRNRQLQRFEEKSRTDREMVSNLDRRLVQQLDLVTSALQEAVLKTRMQPVGIAFQKLPRLCRDLGRRLDKKIRYEAQGSLTEVDKTILQCLSDPLIHLVRNSCDHGLESPPEREAAGKSPTGTVSVRAYQDGGQIVIEVQDDGRGIDVVKVAQRALLKGVCRPQELEAMSDRQIRMLIFAPGFSTAEAVSDVSGRGVGMDVVKTAIEKIGGSVDVNSVVGFGTTFSMRVPLTLAIVSGLIVKMGEQCFAIPQINLDEVVSLHAEEISERLEFINRQPSFRLRGQLLPLVHLKDILRYPDHSPGNILDEQCFRYQTDPNARLTFAVVRIGSQCFGLVVDEAVGTEEIVVKPNHPMLSRVRCFVGSTVLGDGRIALILDVNGVAQHARLETRFSEKSKEQQDPYESAEVLQKLAFTLNGEDCFLFPVSLISRVVSIRRSDLNYLGDACSIVVGGQHLRVVDIARHLEIEGDDECEELSLILPRHINRSVGFLCKKVLHIKHMKAMVKEGAHRHPAILGSVIVEQRSLFVLDMFVLAALEEASWFEDEQQGKTPLGHEKKILLAEDTAFFRRVVGAYLQKLGFEVKVVKNGKEAIERLRSSNHGFDLLVSDLEMPELDGYGLIKRIRTEQEWAHCKKLPALALSSLSSPEARARARALGFNDFELKLNRDSLRTALERLLQDKQPLERVA